MLRWNLGNVNGQKSPVALLRRSDWLILSEKQQRFERLVPDKYKAG